MKANPLSKLLSFLQTIEQKQFSYTLAHHRDKAIMVTVSVSGERWEVKFLDDRSRSRNLQATVRFMMRRR